MLATKYNSSVSRYAFRNVHTFSQRPVTDLLPDSRINRDHVGSAGSFNSILAIFKTSA